MQLLQAVGKAARRRAHAAAADFAFEPIRFFGRVLVDSTIPRVRGRGC